jgi:hypothetical protein
MELKKLLEIVFKVQPKQKDFANVELKGDVLRKIHKELMETDAFANTNLKIIDEPTIKIPIDNVLRGQSCATVNITEDEKFGGDFYLYSISVTPRTYTADIYHQFDTRPVVISPNIYDPETFIPYKYITFKWNTEFAQDVRALTSLDGTAELKGMFHDLLDDVLDSLEKNDNKYLQTASHGVLIRGIWDKRTEKGNFMRLIFD